MKALAFTLAAASLMGCAEGDLDNQTQSVNATVQSTGLEENAQPPTAGGQDQSPAPNDRADGAKAKDMPIRNGGSRPAGPPPADEANACGASRYQYLVGRPRSAIPPKPAGATWRIACTGCPITMDYSPARLNIFYDEDTERIEEVRCG